MLEMPLTPTLSRWMGRGPGWDAVVAILFSQGTVQAVVVQQLHEQMAQLQEVIIGLGVGPSFR